VFAGIFAPRTSIPGKIPTIEVRTRFDVPEARPPDVPTVTAVCKKEPLTNEELEIVACAFAVKLPKFKNTFGSATTVFTVTRFVP
jgi:hypothetical protein